MKAIDDFLSYLRGLNVRVWSEGDSLHYRAPKGTLSAAALAEMQERKAEILEFCRKAKMETAAALPPLQPVSRDGVLPLSFAQQRLWFLHQLEGQTPTYNISSALHLTGALHVSALEQSLSEIVRRHESLRTSFKTVEGKAVQAIVNDLSLPLPVVDLQSHPGAEKFREARRLASEEALRPFDLTVAPLLRTTLLKLDSEQHVLLLTLHHIICDARSIQVFNQELAVLYEAFSNRKPSPLPGLTVQYADFAWHQRYGLNQEILQPHFDYWKRQLAGMPPLLELSTGRQRPAIQTFRGAFHLSSIDADLLRKLKTLGQRAGASLFMTLLSGLALLLSRYSNRDDIPIGYPIANRNRPETESLIGFFVNTLVLRADLSGNCSFLELLGRIKNTALDGYAHQDIPFERLVEALRPERNMSFTPLVQVTLVLLDEEQTKPRLPGLEVEHFEFEVQTARYDLALEVYENESGLSVCWLYNTDVLDSSTIRRMAGQFQTLLASIVAHPGQLISDIPLLSDSEESQTLVEWNDTWTEDSGNVCIQQLFEAQAEQTPGAVAVVHGTSSLTYRALNTRANQLAHYLRALGIGPEVLVGIFVERSLEMMVGLLGILKAGGAYVPIDPSYPKDRVAFLLENSRVPVLVTQKRLARQLPNPVLSQDKLRVICLDEEWIRIDSEHSDNPTSRGACENLAYVIYTSGSTGKPKGTMLTHEGLVNYLNWAVKEYRVADGYGAPVQSSIGFDATITSLFTPLLVGKSVVLLSEKDEIAELSHALQSGNNFSLVKITPAHLMAFRQSLADGEGVGRTRAMVVGGDALFADDLAFWLTHAPETRMINEYGPTESVVGCAFYEVSAETGRTGPIPIGRPIANTQLYILDRNLRPVPTGVPGELHIGGKGIGRGYLRHPELTAEKFIPNPFSKKPGARIYKTGDLARYLPDGNIEYVGRSDNQVKIRGFRIEPGEIESELRQHPEIREAVVIAREGQRGEKRLVAYFVPSAISTFDSGELRAFLKHTLPDHMIPAFFVPMESMPLTPNGKIDRDALPAPDLPERRLKESHEAPGTANEQILATIWSEVLGLEKVGIHENFFELGGDSILSIQIISRAQRAGLPLKPRQLFEYQTIAELASMAGSAEVFPTSQGPVTGPVPLSPIQSWFFEGNQSEPHHYNQSLLLEVLPDVKPAFLNQAIEHILRHHDALRLRFVRDGTTWQPMNLGFSETVPFGVVDLSELPLDEQQSTLEATAAKAQASLSITEGPLLRAVLFILGPDKPARLLLVIHHLVIDGVSWRILLEDLTTAYAQLGRGEEIEFAPKTTSFKEWSECLNAYQDSEPLRRELDYWLAQSRVGIASLPVDFPPVEEANTVASAAKISVSLEVEHTEALLQKVPQAYNTQINDVLLTALLQTICAWSGEESLRVNLEGHGREDLFDDVDLSRTLGWFTTLFPVTLHLKDARDPVAALKSVKEQLRRIPQRGIGYGLLRYLNQETRANLQALAAPAISFNYLGQFNEFAMNAPFLGIAKEARGMEISSTANRRHLLEITGLVIDGKLQLGWIYSTNVHQRSTIEDLAQNLLEALQSIIGHCLAPGAGGYTPSDFPLAPIDQQTLDRILGNGRTAEDLYPLCASQQGLLFHTLYSPKSEVYFEQLDWALSGDLNVGAFKQAWQQVVNRHPALRTAFLWQGLAKPLQIVLREIPLRFTDLDWRDVSPAEQERRLQAMTKADRALGFELDQAPLMRLLLIHTGDNAWRFVWSYHHLLMDGWSKSTVVKEVLALYEAACRGEICSLEQSRPYRDYIAWLQRQDMAGAEAFWRQRLSGFTRPTHLTVQKTQAQPFEQEDVYDEVRLGLSRIQTEALRSLARQNHLTLNTLIQGAWALILNRYSGDEDVVFGATISGRPEELHGIESMVGLFINTLPVRVQVRSEELLIPWLQELQQRHQVERDQYSYTPLVEIQKWSLLSQTVPLFESIVVFENYPVDATLRAQNGSLTGHNVHSFGRSNYPLSLVAVPDSELYMMLVYDRGRFEADDMTRLVGHLQTLLVNMTRHPEHRLSEFSLLSQDERRQVVLEWNATDAEYPDRACIHHIFETRAAQNPERVAVEFGGREISYRELNTRANQLAHYLQARGQAARDGQEILIGLCVERSLEMIVGLLGILKAGGSYVPLDPDYPEERLAFMLTDSRASVLLTQRRLLETLSSSAIAHWQSHVENASVVCLDSDWNSISRESEENPVNELSADSLAYVIYTSGSTGKPKGVAVPHRGINRLVFNTNYVDVKPSDRIAQASNASFDAATFEIWGALLHGARLIGIPREVTLSPHEFAAQIRDREISILFLTTALFNQFAREEPQAFSTLRYLLFGGEAVNPRSVRQVLKSGPPQQLLHVYGPTENVTFSSWHLVEDVPEWATNLPIGRPVSNTQIYVLDSLLQPVPIGIPGELYTGGAGLARGYLHHPALTAEKFIPHPFSDEPGARLYKTGDLVRYLPDGSIEFLGRADHQVKIRGFRVELGEIEAVLREHHAVRDALVLNREDQPGSNRLVAYLVQTDFDSGESENLVSDLRRFLKAKLPDYMVPSAWVTMEALPLNINGKVDRRALPPPDETLREEIYLAPRTQTEERLARIWEEVLEIEKVGVHDNFFDLGGHSLLATQLISRVRANFNIALPLRRLFESPTVASLSEQIDATGCEGRIQSAPIQPASRDKELPLSFAQERLWFLDQLEPGNPFYNTPLALRLRGPLDTDALERSLNEVVRRHEALRTTFATADGQPVQLIAPSLTILLPVLDLRPLAEVERSAEVKRLADEEAQRVFDLARGPLLRATLLRLGQEEHVILLTMHHIISDGWSMGVLIRELSSLYDAFSRGMPSPLPELAIQYADFAAWQRQWFQGEVLETQLRYWKQRLADAPPILKLPSDRPRPASQSFRGSAQRFEVDEDVTRDLKALSQRSGATLFMTLHAVFATLLHRYSAQQDIIIGSPIANRNRAEIEPLMGFFVNTLALRTDLSGDPTFLELLNRVQQLALDAYAHQDLPFERLVDVLQPERDLSQNPLFQVMFTLQNAPTGGVQLTDLIITAVETERVTALFDVVLDLWETGQGLTGVLEYNTDLFDAPTIVRMVGHFQNLLAAIAANPEQRISDLSILNQDERHQLLVEWNNTRAAFPVHESLHQLFQEQVEAAPNRVAAVHSDRETTYAKLNEKANQIARLLRRIGVGRNDFVAILHERGIDFLSAMLGVLKAGGGFLPVDPDYPGDRVRYMVADSQAHTLITRFPLLEKLDLRVAGESLRNIVCFDQRGDFEVDLIQLYDASDLARQEKTNPAQLNQSCDLAYMLYTSGSTGLPKGAMIRHDGAVNHIYAQFEELAFHPGTAFLQSAPSSSDISVWQFLAPLLIGGRTVIADFDTVCDPAKLFEIIKSQQVTLIELVPVVLKQLLEYAAQLPLEDRALPALEWAMVTGETVPVSLVNQWLANYPAIKLVNAYGPTEAADDICQFAVDRPLPGSQLSVPIGRPLANLTLYVLDRNLNLLPIGVPGEICVSGIGVGAGYWRNQEKTRASFIPNPYHDDGRGQVLYRTGDVGRWRADGTLELMGRLDDQVKIRGFRIELGEIEGMLGQNSAVGETSVIVREDQPGEKRLVAYVVPDSNGEWWQERKGELQAEQISLWESLHDNDYSHPSSHPDPTFNTMGWDSTYTGLPLSDDEMHEYVDRTVERILSVQPSRILEIGCGTGLLAFRLAPHCERYLGTDLSGVAVRRLQELKRSVAGVEHVTLLHKSAHDFEEIEPEAFDTVVINSVAQYFPSIDYLVRVLEGAVQAVATGGSVFVGDVRSLPLLEAYHTSVQLYKAPSSLSCRQLRQRVGQHIAQEQELVIDPAFFVALKQHLPRISHVQIQPKRGRHHNELTRFRYDVTLHTGDGFAAMVDVPWVDWQEERLSLPRLRRFLADTSAEVIGLRGVSNARIQDEIKSLEWLASHPDSTNVALLREELAQRTIEGLDPEELWELGRDSSYDVDLSCSPSGANGRYDVVFRRRSAAATRVSREGLPFIGAAAGVKPWTGYVNNPLQEKFNRDLVQRLRSFLKDKLPNYMVPSDFSILESLPLTPSGKVDRRALPAPDTFKSGLETGYVAPRTSTEKALADIWAKILGRDQIGIHDNFFDLGGHSLKATQVVSRIHRNLEIEVALREIFSQPTIEELARRIEDIASEKSESRTPYAWIEKVPDADHYPLSHAQRRVWVLSHMGDGSIAYNMPGALLLEGDIHLEALEHAFRQLVRRHESLRTTFIVVDEEPRQKIHVNPDSQLSFVDLTEDIRPEERARELALEDARKPFDLVSGPLIRLSLLKLAENRHVLLFNMHHIISDDWSMAVLVREFVHLYECINKLEASSLPPLSIQYRDYACWQNRLLNSEAAAVHRDYWHQKLSGELPVLNLPTDLSRPPIKTYNGQTLAFNLGAKRTKALQSFCRRQNVSLFMTLVAVVKVLLHRYTDQTDIIVGCPIAGRNHADLEDQIGFYINTIALRDQVQGETPFEAFLEQVKRTATEAYDHQVYPFDRLVDELKLIRDVSRSPMFDIMVVLQNAKTANDSLEKIRISPFIEEYGVSKFDLGFTFEEKEDGLEVALVYNTDLFLGERIQRIGHHFQKLVTSILEDAGQPLGQLKILPEAERRQLLNEFNPDTDHSCDKTIVDLFEEQAGKTPDAPAVVYEDRELTYRELNARANQLAHHLRSLGVRTNDLVGICADRSLDMVVGLLGILKAGAAYVPFDLAYPRDRLAFMLNDCQVPVLLTQQALASGLPPHQAQVLCLDKDWDLIARQSQENPPSEATPANLAYVIYTSGSTGQPKGTLVSHHNVTRLFAATRSWFNFDHRDVWTLFHSYAFDFSVWELWGALLHGGRLVVIPYWVSRSPEAFYDLLRAQRVTVLNQTPSAFRQLIQVDQAQAASLTLRLVIFGGEALELQSLKPWFDQHGDHSPLLVNMYGITETTVHVTYRPITLADLNTTASLIGIPIPDLQVYILDSYLQPVPIGIPGEMYVGGAGLAQSYLHRPDLTADRFIPNPFTSQPGARLYKSGDLARYQPNGDIEYFGRLDHQVKIRGFRVEPGEIEAVLATHPAVRHAVVIARQDHPGDKLLAAYLVPNPHHTLPLGELRALLKEKLPDYMMPANFVILDTLPLTANGKIDRRALPAPDQTRPEVEAAFIAPRNEAERTIASIWKDVLNVEKVGIHDNFFDLGGHSLAVIQVHNRLRTIFNNDLSVVELFKYSTISALSEYLSRGQDAHEPAFEQVQGRVSLQIEAKKLRKQRKQSHE